MICGYFKPKFYKNCKKFIKFIKIRLNLHKKKKNAMVNFWKKDIMEILKIGHEHDERAYKKVEELLEYRRIISSYDLMERFCDCISSNLSLMLKQSECPEECREAVYSLIYAAAWVRNVRELKDRRALFTRRYGESIETFVNQELVEKLVWRKPSREVRVQTLKEIAQEGNIRWDPVSLQLKLLRHTSTLQIEQKETSKVKTGVDDPNVETESNIRHDQSQDESDSRRRDSLSKCSLRSSSSSSSRRIRSVKKIFPYGLKPNDENPHEEKKGKSAVQENSWLRGPQGSASLTSTSNNQVFSTRDYKRESSFQRPKILDYDEFVARLAHFSRR